MNAFKHDRDKNYVAALNSPVLDSSDFILLSINYFKSILKEEKKVDLTASMGPIFENYTVQNYQDAITRIKLVCEQNKDIINPEIYQRVQAKADVLYDNPNKDKSRRFFETRLSIYLEDSLKESKAFSSLDGFLQTMKNLGSNISTRKVESWEDASKVVSRICTFNDRIELGYKELSKHYPIKDKGVRSLSHRDRMETKNPGIMKSTDPNFYDFLLVAQEIRRIPDVNEIEAKKSGYSSKNPIVPFVASISGTTFTLVALLDKYMEKNKADSNLNVNVNNIVKSFISFYIKNGFHSLREITDVLNEKPIQDVFLKYGVKVDLAFPPNVLEKSFTDALDYAKTYSLKSALNAELAENKHTLKAVPTVSDEFLAAMKKGKIREYVDKPEKVYLVFANGDDMKNAVSEMDKEISKHPEDKSPIYRIAGQENTLEVYDRYQKLMRLKEGRKESLLGTLSLLGKPKEPHLLSTGEATPSPGIERKKR